MKKSQARGSLIIFFFFLFSSLSLGGCYTVDKTYFPHEMPSIDIIVKTPKEDITASSLIIFNFHHATGIKSLGGYLADYTQKILLEEKFIQEISRVETHFYGIPESLELARQKGHDLLLIGYVDNFVDGGLTSHSVVGFSIKLIDVRSRITLWYLRGQLKSAPWSGVDFLMARQKTEKAQSPYLLSRILLEKMWKKFFKKA